MSRSIFSVFRVVQISLQWILEPLNHPNKKPGTHYQSLKGQVGWHHRLKGHEFELALGDGDGQGGLACCSPWGRKESDTTERLKNNNKTAGFFKKKKKVRSLSHVRLFATPWTAAYQAFPSLGFSRQEYWSGLFSISMLETEPERPCL